MTINLSKLRELWRYWRANGVVEAHDDDDQLAGEPRYRDPEMIDPCVEAMWSEAGVCDWWQCDDDNEDSDISRLCRHGVYCDWSSESYNARQCRRRGNGGSGLYALPEYRTLSFELPRMFAPAAAASYFGWELGMPWLSWQRTRRVQRPDYMLMQRPWLYRPADPRLLSNRWLLSFTGCAIVERYELHCSLCYSNKELPL